MIKSNTIFMDKLISKKGHLIHKFRATDTTGEQAYYYVLMELQKELAFNRALETGSGTINFADFGKVIASCYGEHPTEEVKKFLKDKYGFDV